MRTIVQRVARAAVQTEGETVGSIGPGCLLLVGVEEGDTAADALATADKIASMRIFPGRTPMDRTLLDIGGSCLVVSQFTLAAALKKGHRPSFTRAAAPELAQPLYGKVAAALREKGLEVATGRFGANMQVELINDGPVTFVLDVKDGKILQ